ncbi:MAG: bifunctional phosphopantothenoylcysteine decarboxylase/phosphopantothenate--cysteine ligase CoaBC [Proteobacteria bacterium]|nr:bifunctional phosphopantothenoylcysteine decarboxylase/phosphopantothenate--cysteine ligase CoaBC [Pseudomonadota bacterium]
MKGSLKGKSIVFGIGGGIAAYKCCELARLLTKAGADVRCVLTSAGSQFVTPITLQTLTANPVHTDMWNLIQEKEIGHISLADRADLVLVAPATADLIAKVAHGICDDLLTTVICATKAPVLFAPSMNSNMWENPITQGNVAALKKHGYRFIEPAVGELACGYKGKGRLPEPSDILKVVVGML